MILSQNENGIKHYHDFYEDTLTKVARGIITYKVKRGYEIVKIVTTKEGVLV